MDVVNYSEAARVAGVSRVMISKLKKLHLNKESEKSYFVFDPKSGKEGIDLDDKSWIKYVNKNNKQRSNQKKSAVTTKCKPIEVNEPELVNKKTFALAVILAIKETLDISGSDLKKLSKVISLKYEEMEKG